ncbi:ethylene-responsive transcription factor ERF021-like protein [Tanacetum coccineum]|uniref:Ethylene-responsive transcription factor ERF021-like protein n=1 Tax=Tanacetum coccineum TaxID=301880 RepID=A0ABQ5DUW3_9ASTR
MSDNRLTSGSTSVYRGVRKRKYGKWVSEVREPKGKSIWLGSFDTPEMAAIAHDAISYYFRGDTSRLNFPHLANTLPRPTSSSAEDIRLAAHEATLLVNHSTPEIGSGSGSAHTVPTNIGLSASQIQAINDSPLDSSETWMDHNNHDTQFYHANDWDEVPDDSIWGP